METANRRSARSTPAPRTSTSPAPSSDAARVSDSVEDERAAPRARGGRRGPPRDRTAAAAAGAPQPRRVYKPYVYSEAQRARKAAYKRERRRREKEQRCVILPRRERNERVANHFSRLTSFLSPGFLFSAPALQRRGVRSWRTLVEHVCGGSRRGRRCPGDRVDPPLFLRAFVSQGKFGSQSGISLAICDNVLAIYARCNDSATFLAQP